MDLGGLTVPLPTLFAEDGSLDTARNSRFARTLSEAGVDHLFVLGSLGEFPCVDTAERGRLVDTVVESATRGADVWVGIGAPSTAQAIAYADEAEGLGASALVAVPPYYLHPSPAAVERYYRAIAAEVSVPLLAYNIPHLVGYSIEPALVHRLARDRVLSGIKDTGAELASVLAFQNGAPDGFVVLTGNDRLASGAFAHGGIGAVMGLANIVPRLCVELVRHGRRGEGPAAAPLQSLVDRLGDVVDRGPFPSTVKFLAQRLRAAEVGYRSPYDPLTEQESAAVLELLAPLEPELSPFLRP